MFISPAYAQAATEGSAANAAFSTIFPFVIVFVIFYFLLIRPQQQARKKHMEMIAAVKKGDTVVTSGGIVGKVTKVLDDAEIKVEIADKVEVKVLKSSLTNIVDTTKPANDQ
jgi:preprotein translocase subunit YajC